MKVIVLSDTHGQFSHINKLVEIHNADAVIHCGDFGFMTHDRTSKLTSRELSLNIKHCPNLPTEIRKQAWNYSESKKIELINEHRVLGEFDEYLNGSQKFKVPVYAVWGNHEDSEVIRNLIRNPIENLNLLTSEPTQLLDSEITLFGVGGNINLRRFFNKPLSEELAPFMTFQEWVEIRQNIKKHKFKSDNTWMITHVSPGKEPLLELFALHFRPQMWFSGHMGAPLPQHYSLFTYIDDPDFYDRLTPHLEAILSEFEKWEVEVLKWHDVIDFIDAHSDLAYTDLMQQSISRVYFDSDSFEYKRNTSNVEGYIGAMKSNNSFVSTYPDKSTFKMILGNASLFKSPISNEGKSTNYYGRKSSGHVKGTWYWNLPDVYTGGYLAIDSNTPNGDWQNNSKYHISTFGYLN